MATTIVMPALGNSVETCIINAWVVKEGDHINLNDTIAEIETDKSSMEIPATEAGTVLSLLFQEGDEVPVMQPIMIVGDKGEDLTSIFAEIEHSKSDNVQIADQLPVVALDGVAKEEHVNLAVASSPSKDKARVSPRARILSAQRGIDPKELSGTGPQGRVIERDILAVSKPTTVAAKVVSGSVQVSGTGLGGRLTTADIEKDIENQKKLISQPATLMSVDDINYPGNFTDTPLKGIRKIVAERMLNSLLGSAQLTFNSSAPAAGLLALRKRLKNSNPELGLNKITIGDLVAFAAVKTVQKYPAMNAHLENQTLRHFDHVHLGIAVDTPRGLIVPTVRFASEMSLKQFSTVSKSLAEGASTGHIDPELLQGATFTVTNLGAYGIESFTPILNLPQTAILGVNNITTRAVINADDTISAQQCIGFSITVDHRVVDGADAARYLQDLAAAITDIDLSVLG